MTTNIAPPSQLPTAVNNVPVSYGATDEELALAIDQSGGVLILMTRAYLFIVLVMSAGNTRAKSGELGDKSVAVLKRFAASGSLHKVDWPDTIGDRPPLLPAALAQTGHLLGSGDIVAWRGFRERLLKLGRGPSLSSAGKTEVLKDAANVCMFQGCGKRVDKIGKSARLGNVGQLAHIVGADPNGPRGRDDSHQLADKPENVMLVCYDHHRLVDAIDPEGHTIAVLQEMRRAHMSRVTSLLAQLAWPRALPLVIRGGIAGQIPAITYREISEALEGIGMSALHPEGEHLTMAPIERPNSNYGYLVLSQLKPAIQRLITAGQSGLYGASQDTLAIFALHDTPVLVLAGRIIGEARTTRVFQRDRGLGTWQWANPKKLISDVILDVQVRATATSGKKTGLLVIAVSDRYQEAWLPDTARQSIAHGRMTLISIAALKPGMAAVEAPCDLVNILGKIREELRRLQGDYQVEEVEIIMAAPVSIAIAVGQALQAGNHLPTTIFHRPNSSGPFEPAFKIFSDRVESADTGVGLRVSVPLQ